MANQTPKQTPMMRQYWEIKSRYPDKDTILFFRLGDFYEMFFEDAEIASRILDIALTSRNKSDDNPVPLCGIPYHAADNYISKLLASGKKVAICEQVEDPAEAKGIVRRDVIRVITPGTITEPDNLEATRYNYLAAIHPLKGKWGLAVIDVTTGDFRVTEFDRLHDLLDELSRLEASELLISRSLAEEEDFAQEIKGVVRTVIDDPTFDPTKINDLKRVKGVKIPDSARAAAGAILHYVEYTAKEVLKHIHGIEVYETRRYMVVDESTQRNLELTKTMIDASRYGSLLWLMDQTLTPMGARLLRDWILHPLVETEPIAKRLDAVQTLVGDIMLCEDLGHMLERISDLERAAGRIAMETANARELVALKQSLKILPGLIKIQRDPTGLLKDILKGIDPLDDIDIMIEATLNDEPPLSLREGGLIKQGIDAELDELRTISGEGKGFIAKLEASEKAKTGISSLKVRYNKVFGYYIDVTNTHKDKVPPHYIRKQTLANSERYITDELKGFEEKVLGAEEKIKAMEFQIFSKLRSQLVEHVSRIKKTATRVAELDVLLSLAELARRNRYVRPEMTDSTEIEISEGRHPIIEKIHTGDRFIPNDSFLNNTTDRLLIITGPNMAGKSTVMRQVALIVLMAQIGSFVPATKAKIGIVDRIFTRVGASDNIMRGQSTFMVEMQEAASILKEATERSLIIIDEIGRGTSTFDGLAIAWAVAEYIHDTIQSKTLFATHYHELTDLEVTKESVKNYNIAVKEWNDKIIFLHKIVPGGVSHSYGIQVAQLAGLPKAVIERSREILANLETGELDEVGQPKLAYSKAERKEQIDVNQLQLFHQAGDHPVIEELKAANVEVMTPIEALNLLHKLKSEA